MEIKRQNKVIPCVCMDLNVLSLRKLTQNSLLLGERCNSEQLQKMQVAIGSMTAAVHDEFNPFSFVLRVSIIHTGYEN